MLHGPGKNKFTLRLTRKTAFGMMRRMATQIPQASLIRENLQKLAAYQLRSIAAKSNVPFTTLLKIRSGETKNPGIETVRAFFPYLPRSSSGK